MSTYERARAKHPNGIRVWTGDIRRNRYLTENLEFLVSYNYATVTTDDTDDQASYYIITFNRPKQGLSETRMLKIVDMSEVVGKAGTFSVWDTTDKVFLQCPAFPPVMTWDSIADLLTTFAGHTEIIGLIKTLEREQLRVAALAVSEYWRNPSGVSQSHMDALMDTLEKILGRQ